MEKGKNKILILLIAVVVLLIGGILGYKYYTNKPQNLYKNALNTLYKKASEMLKENEEKSIQYTFDNTIMVDGDLKLNTNIPELSEYTKQTYGFRFGLDIKNEKGEFGVSVKENENKIIEFLGYIIENKIYLKSEKIFDKIIYQENEEDLFDFSEIEKLDIKREDLDYLIKVIIENISKSVEKENLSKSNETIKFNNEDLKVTKSTLLLNESSMYNISLGIIDGLKEDDKALEILAKFSQENKEDIKNTLNSVNKEENPFENMEEIKVNIYTKGFMNEVIGFNVVCENKEIISFIEKSKIKELNINIEKVNIKVNGKDNLYQGKIINEKEEIINFAIESNQKDKETITDLKFNVFVEDSVIKGEASLSEVIENAKKVVNKLKGNVKITAEENVEIGFDLNIKFLVDEKIGDIKIEEAVNVEKLLEKDLVKMQNNLMEVIEKVPLLQLFLMWVKAHFFLKLNNRRAIMNIGWY